MEEITTLLAMYSYSFYKILKFVIDGQVIMDTYNLESTNITQSRLPYTRVHGIAIFMKELVNE